MAAFLAKQIVGTPFSGVKGEYKYRVAGAQLELIRNSFNHGVISTNKKRPLSNELCDSRGQRSRCVNFWSAKAQEVFEEN